MCIDLSRDYSFPDANYLGGSLSGLKQMSLYHDQEG